MQENSLDDKLFDAILKVALEEVYRQEMKELESCEEMNEKYRPSPEFDRKIRKMISRYYRKRMIQKIKSWFW